MSSANRTAAIMDLLDQMRAQSGEFASPRIEMALRIAGEVYGDAQHWSGESVVDHVAGVLKELMAFEPDEDAVVACILHHVLMSKEWTLVDLEEQFGSKVRSLVSGVHLLSHVTIRGRRSSIDDLRLMLLTVSDDVRTVLMTLCDRCHLLKRLSCLEPADRTRVCQDVLQLFAPVAARLGIYSIKHQLESSAFPVLYANDAERIYGQIARMNSEHGNFIDDAAKRLENELNNRGLHVTIKAREKQPYSLFTKMRQKSLSHVEDVYDFYALRVIVDSVEECYQVLGVLHQMGRPIAHRFKDYISFPKPNGYQSLHTTMAQLPGFPEDVLAEVQVRTKDMQREADYGIAAHWSYKQYGSTTLAMENAQLHQMLASQEVLESDEGESSLVDHIFVLTPTGDILELPEGATPLDFAFLVHTELGLSFRGARVNGAMVPINYQLENGDIVEVLRHSVPRPSTQWLQLLKMSSARAKLKRYLYAQERPQLLMQGRKMVNDELRKRSLPLLDTDLSILRRCDNKTLSFQQREDLLVKIGQGSERASSLFDRLEVFKEEAPVAKTTEAPEVVTELHGSHVVLDVPMPFRFAKCCKPDQGSREAIVGGVNREGTVLIHRKSCKMLRNANKARQVKARWEKVVTKK